MDGAAERARGCGRSRLDARSADSLRPGDIVSLATKPEAPVRPVDRHIADVASKGGGIYELERDSSPDAGRAARRMRDLERLGLATAAGPNRWTVSPNLLDDLERKHRDAPARHRLLLHKQPLNVQEQVRHPGPVWLDRIDTASLAPYGLGAEVRRAVGQRRGALRQLGVATDDPNRWAKLRELERRSVGNDVAASSGQSFIPSAPDGFRGRVLAHATPTGASYTVVSDGARFVVVKTTRPYRASRACQSPSPGTAMGESSCDRPRTVASSSGTGRSFFPRQVDQHAAVPSLIDLRSGPDRVEPRAASMPRTQLDAATAQLGDD